MKQTLAKHLTVVALLHSAHAIAISSKQIMTFLLQKKELTGGHREELKHVIGYIENAESLFLDAVLNIHKGIPPSAVIISLFEKFPIAIDTISSNSFSGLEIIKGYHVALNQLHNNGIAFERIREALDQQLLTYQDSTKDKKVKKLKKKLKKAKKGNQNSLSEGLSVIFRDFLAPLILADAQKSNQTQNEEIDLSALDALETQIKGV